MKTQAYPVDPNTLVDHIFKYGKSFWRIISFSNRNKNEVFNVVKCNKNGVMFSETNGFTLRFVMKLYKENQLIKAKSNEEAKNDGSESGIRKRRIGYLKATIVESAKELVELMKLEGSSQAVIDATIVELVLRLKHDI